LIVKPFISFISAIYQKNLINARFFLQFTKQTLSKTEKNLRKVQDFSFILLIKCRNFPIIITSGT
jgi:hypothetical protein